MLARLQVLGNGRSLTTLVIGFRRSVQGTAELSSGNDVLRLWLQSLTRVYDRLPIVLAATPR